jgi:hypothetical protein
MADFSLNNLAPYAEGLFQTATIQDWKQTSTGAKNNYTEKNPIMGSHPSQGKINVYFPAVMAAHYAGYKALPDDYKLPYALGSALIEGNVVNQNRKNNQGQGINVPLLGLGGLVTAALAADWNKSHKDKKLSPYFDLGGQSGKTPVLGLTMQW